MPYFRVNPNIILYTKQCATQPKHVMFYNHCSTVFIVIFIRSSFINQYMYAKVTYKTLRMENESTPNSCPRGSCPQWTMDGSLTSYSWRRLMYSRTFMNN